MILKERVRIIWASVFIILALGLAVYFFTLITNIENTQEASIIIAILTALVALIVSLLSNVKLRKTWKK